MVAKQHKSSDYDLYKSYAWKQNNITGLSLGPYTRTINENKKT